MRRRLAALAAPAAVAALTRARTGFSRLAACLREKRPKQVDVYALRRRGEGSLRCEPLRADLRLGS